MTNLRSFMWLALCVLGACAKITPSTGGSSETHFLAPCDATCADGLSCVCGVCTERCEADSACDELPGAASCQAATEGCGAAMICDVECGSDDDCSALSARHACEEGRCRAPVLDPVVPDVDAGDSGPGSSGAGGSAGTLATSGTGGMDTAPFSGGAGASPAVHIPRCDLHDVVVHHLEEDKSYSVCPVFATPSECAEVARNGIEFELGFLIEWQTLIHASPIRDKVVVEGFFGAPGADGFKFYKYLQDEGVSWTECADFAIEEACEELADCFRCDVGAQEQCSCADGERPSEVLCTAYEAPKLCLEESDCLIDSICYPDGASTEDGCCACENGAATCIEPEWCPGWPSISKRCETESDCGGGLECRTELPGELGVCTRPCNYGCPTGTLCFNNLVDDDDQPIDEGLCLRPCESNDDCAIEVNGEPLGTVCQAFDENAGPAGGCL